MSDAPRRTSIVHARSLYLALLLVTVALYGITALRSAGLPGDAPAPDAPKATRATLPDVTPERLANAARTQPGLMALLAGWLGLGVTLCVGGFVLSARRLRCRPAPPPAGLPFAWTPGDALRLLLLLGLVMLLLPFVHMGLAVWNLGWVQDQHVWSLTGMFLLYALLFLLIRGFSAAHGVPARAMFGLTHPPGRVIPRALAAYVAAFPWIVLLLVASGVVCRRFGIEPPVEAIHELVFLEPRPWVLGMTVLLACVVGPIAEELVFRGVIFSALRPRVSGGLAMAISGSLFAAMHTNLVGFIPILALGMLLAERYERTGSLLAPIVIHIAHNSMLMGLALTIRRLL